MSLQSKHYGNRRFYTVRNAHNAGEYVIFLRLKGEAVFVVAVALLFIFDSEIVVLRSVYILKSEKLRKLCSRLRLSLGKIAALISHFRLDGFDYL
jgi:hypothetical protein